MNNKDFRKLKINECWHVAVNRMIEDDYLEDILIFNGINQKTKEVVDVYFTDENIGYTLYYSKDKIENGIWNRDIFDRIPDVEKSDKNLEVINRDLEKILNPDAKDLVSLKIHAGWTICKNSLLNNLEKFTDFEQILFITKNKFFINVHFDKNNPKPYYFCCGKNKYNFEGINYVSNDYVKKKEFQLNDLNEVIELIELFMINPEENIDKK
ncbi:hypothetical protein [Aureivirga marina]|uniref:hypothetical protein n=1 Tax=Aureivirga marina TaxID=1182451 RepID=UPI0018CAAD0B|nr:hypothetical protein [Aureivirga marina]